MKKIFALLLALTMAISLAACGSKEDTSSEDAATATEGESSSADPRADWGPEPTETTEVVVWTFYGETMKNQFQDVADAFNASQTKYHVTIESQGSQAEMNAKIQSTAQEDLPAMFHGAVENVAMYAAADYCVPIQEFIDMDEESWGELENTWAAIRTAYQDDAGNQIGYPQGYSYGGLFYNADMFSEAGINVADIQSMDDLYAASEKLVEGGYTTYGTSFHPDGFYFNAILGREGIYYYDNDNGYSGQITECLYVSDPTVNAAVKNMLTVYQNLHANNYCVPYGTDYNKEIIPMLADGSCASMIGVVSMTTKILNAVDGKFEVGIVPLPSATENGKRTGEAAGGTGNFIANCTNKWAQQGAYEFIKFASTAEQAGYFASVTGYLVPNSDAYDSEVYIKYLTETFPAVSVVYDSLNKSDSSAACPYIPISNEMKAANNLAIQTVSADPSASVDDAIKTANDTIQEAIDLYNLSNS